MTFRAIGTAEVQRVGDGAPDRAGVPLSDWRELGAGEFRVDEEAERIQQLALLHQPEQNRLPKIN
jgi:hypothetical protein